MTTQDTGHAKGEMRGRLLATSRRCVSKTPLAVFIVDALAPHLIAPMRIRHQLGRARQPCLRDKSYYMLLLNWLTGLLLTGQA